MAILGIRNRTENWKTARTLVSLGEEGRVELTNRLLPRRERGDLQPGDVQLELFWRGIRDYLKGQPDLVKEQERRLAAIYHSRFGEVRQQVKKFVEAGKFKKLTGDNYRASNNAQKRRLRNNLRHTEIDIVLESPKHLFIGEAKHESDFGGNSNYILTHQLIRQYVMARILIELSGAKREIVPFVVGDDSSVLNNSHQVQFMIEQKWMRRENVLTWSDIEALW